jgi:hypothetical protein
MTVNADWNRVSKLRMDKQWINVGKSTFLIFLERNTENCRVLVAKTNVSNGLVIIKKDRSIKSRQEILPESELS